MFEMELERSQVGNLWEGRVPGRTKKPAPVARSGLLHNQLVACSLKPAAACEAGWSDVDGFQRREAVELDGAVAGGVGAGREPVHAVADGEVQGQAVFVAFLKL